tara:strand:+ start:3294 stop:3545 length:252 start_codon:yes stop_codon:yes gene_type:complete
MSYEHKENSGTLFPVNPEDVKSDKHPNYSGKCMIKGNMYYISGWKNTSQNGKKYLSLSFKPVDDIRVEPEPQDVKLTPEEIPF